MITKQAISFVIISIVLFFTIKPQNNVPDSFQTFQRGIFSKTSRLEVLDSSRWELVWAEEFNNLNTEYWTIEDSFWKKNPDCLYKPGQVEVINGELIISAQKVGKEYHTGKLQSKGKVSFTYGKIEALIKAPSGKGLKTAYWMLGEKIDQTGWPKCGEIDIMEQRGFEPKHTHHNVHWFNDDKNSLDHSLYGMFCYNQNITDSYHKYSIIWDSSQIAYYFDDELIRTVDVTPGHKSEFHQPFYFIIQLDVGSKNTWPGPVDPNLEWPKKLCVDYIRVYLQKPKDLTTFRRSDYNYHK